MTDRFALSNLKPGDPQRTRFQDSRESSELALRNINVCSVRPNDLITHHGHAVLVTDRHGWISKSTQGFFFHQTRYLSRLALKVDKAEPKFVSANAVDHHILTSYHLAPSSSGKAAAPPGADGSSGSEIDKKAIEVQVNVFVGSGLHVDVIITNHALACSSTIIFIKLEADFADLTEAQSGKRRQHGLVARTWKTRDTDPFPAGELALVYRHPKLQLATQIRIQGGDALTDLGDAIACELTLEPQTPQIISLDLIPVFQGGRNDPHFGRDGTRDHSSQVGEARRRWIEGCVRVSVNNKAVQAAWDQAVSDLASLQSLEGPDEEVYLPLAGIPKYIGIFGRDAYVTSLQSAILNPATLRGSLEAISHWNATETNDFLDMQPGKVLHQRQLGPLAQLGLTPFGQYYGDQSTPGLFLLSAAADLTHTGDIEAFRALRSKLLSTLDWMERNADEEGFFPYQTRSSQGLKNQSWKDSGDAVLYPDGRIVDDPIAMCDIQGLFYAGKRAAALAFAVAGDDALSKKLLAEAEVLKAHFNERFWMPEEQYFAMALDPEKKQVRTIASDAGACLAYGIVDEDKAAAVADRLLREDMFSGWGIRTLSAKHPAYNPFAYHLGSIWPSPNSITAYGLKRYGFVHEAHQVAAALFAASQVFDLDRLPEVFGGHQRDARHPHPGLYPGACSPQAWSSGAIIFFVSTMLGIMPFAPRNMLIVDPALPDWLPEVTVHNIRVGAARASLRFRLSQSGSTDLEVLEDGGLHIIRPASPIKPGMDRIQSVIEAGLEWGKRA